MYVVFHGDDAVDGEKFFINAMPEIGYIINFGRHIGSYRVRQVVLEDCCSVKTNPLSLRSRNLRSRQMEVLRHIYLEKV